MKQASQISIDEKSYSKGDFSAEGQSIISTLSVTSARILELQNIHAIMTRAKNAYIQDLSAEIVEQKSGVDLSAIFSDDEF